MPAEELYGSGIHEPVPPNKTEGICRVKLENGEGTVPSVSGSQVM